MERGIDIENWVYFNLFYVYCLLLKEISIFAQLAKSSSSSSTSTNSYISPYGLITSGHSVILINKIDTVCRRMRPQTAPWLTQMGSLYAQQLVDSILVRFFSYTSSDLNSFSLGHRSETRRSMWCPTRLPDHSFIRWWHRCGIGKSYAV